MRELAESLHKDFRDILDEVLKRPEFTTQELALVCCLLRMRSSADAVILLVSKGHVHEAYSSTRNFLEGLVWLIALWRSDDPDTLLKRLHANFLVDKIDLIKIVLKSSAHGQMETAESVRKYLESVESDLSEMCDADLGPLSKNPTDNLAAMGRVPNLKRHYYKLLSLYTHPTLHGIEKFIRQDGPNSVAFLDCPETDAEEVILEALSNFIKLSISVMNTVFALGVKVREANGYLDELEKNLAKGESKDNQEGITNGCS